MKKNVKNNKKIGQAIVFVCLILTIVSALVTFNACEFLEYTNPYIENLSIEITLNQDGSANIKEVHEVAFEERDDDWWNYYKVIGLRDSGSGNYGETLSTLTNLSVKVDGNNYDYNPNVKYSSDLDSMSNSKKEFYQSTYYQTDSSYTNKTEIGVIMPAFSVGKKTIEISYTLSNLMLQYVDCDGLYYKFVSDDNTMYINNFYAKVNFFQPVNEDSVAIWTHIDTGSAANYLDTNGYNYVEYKGEDIAEEMYVETRILFKDDIYLSSKLNEDTFDKIVAQENAWKEAHFKEVEKINTMKTIDYVVMGIIIAAIIALVVFFIYKRRPYVDHNAPEYIRDIPTGYTAGEAEPIYEYYDHKTDVADGISATIMDLFRREYINIKEGEKKKQAVITINRTDVETLFDADLNVVSGLAPHERTIFELLKTVAQYYGGEFTMKEMERYADKYSERVGKIIKTYEKQAKEKTVNVGCYPGKKDKLKANYTKGATMLAIAGFIVLMFTYVLSDGLWTFAGTFIACIIGAIALGIVASRKKAPLTRYGQQEHNKMVAFARFMTDFSKMDEHTIPELVMWEEYMVFATAFGIADEVSKQLEIKYPKYTEVMDNTSYYANDRRYLMFYYCSPRFRMRHSFGVTESFKSINTNIARIEAAKKAAANAKKYGGGSGGRSGGGGGFRGGGGGFGGGGMGAR